MKVKLFCLCSLLLFFAACAGKGDLRYPPVRWMTDDDRRPIDKPDKVEQYKYADIIEKQVSLQLIDLADAPYSLIRGAADGGPQEARNVNNFDEVANSTWFENRIGLFPMSLEEVARGSCPLPPPDPGEGPWVVTRAKTQGMNPGFFVKVPNGKTYLLKFDGMYRPTRATAADVIGSKFYHAVVKPADSGE